MRLGICGTDEKALKIKLLLDKLAYNNIIIEMFIGPKTATLDGIDVSVVTEDDLFLCDYSSCLDGFIISPEHYGTTRQAIYKKIKSSIYGNKKIYMPDFEILYNMSASTKMTVENILVPYEESSQLFYLEVHASDHCNLNCKGCMHFSPLVKESVFPDFNKLSEDIHQLNKFIKHIDIIRILGGEPLLNPHLERYINLLRSVFPYSNINIVTNGLLIDKMSDDLCKCIQNNNIHVHISLYPPVIKNKDKIESYLKANNIVYQISESIDTFTSTYQSKPFVDKFFAKDNCEIFCNNLRDGKMSCCPNIMYTKYYNDCFGTNYPIEDGLIDIYKIRSCKELHQRLNQPAALCSYCDRRSIFNWEITKRRQTEWLAREVDYGKN